VRRGQGTVRLHEREQAFDSCFGQRCAVVANAGESRIRELSALDVVIAHGGQLFGNGHAIDLRPTRAVALGHDTVSAFSYDFSALAIALAVTMACIG
jgi:hypothetical protein